MLIDLSLHKELLNSGDWVVRSGRAPSLPSLRASLLCGGPLASVPAWAVATPIPMASRLLPLQPSSTPQTILKLTCAHAIPLPEPSRASLLPSGQSLDSVQKP